MDRRRAVLKALDMKIAAVGAVLDADVVGAARKKTMEFIDIPHDQLVERIRQGEFKTWKRKSH